MRNSIAGKLLFNLSVNRSAFTLAEVLITLGIIGIVAAMTLPTLIHKYQAKVLESQFKQTYSLIQQAYNLTLSSLGDVSADDFMVNDSTGFYRKDEFKNEFYKHVKLSDKKPDKITYYTYGDKNIKYESDKPSYSITQIYEQALSNGAYIRINITGGSDGISQFNCLYFYTDINGKKGPNRVGFDVFNFVVYQNTNGKLTGSKMSKSLTEDELKELDSPYNGMYGYPCSAKSKQSANGIGCTWYAIANICPDDSTKTYWECLPK